MNKFVILLIIILTSFSNYSQSKSELYEIEKTLNYYLEGGTNNDFEMLSKAFHKNASMKFISNNIYKEVNAIEFFKKIIKPGPRQNRKTKITYIDINGFTASSKIEIEYETMILTDYMNLLKIDGEWKIVSKIYNRSNKS